MKRDIEKDLIEIEAAIKSQREKDNMFTMSVLQRCHKLVLELQRYRESGLEPEEKIKECISFLQKNGYVVKRWTKLMETDANECVELEENGKNKDCCGCACSVCLMQ